jgi:hypothetical protein
MIESDGRVTLSRPTSSTPSPEFSEPMYSKRGICPESCTASRLSFLLPTKHLSISAHVTTNTGDLPLALGVSGVQTLSAECNIVLLDICGAWLPLGIDLDWCLLVNRIIVPVSYAVEVRSNFRQPRWHQQVSTEERY